MLPVVAMVQGTGVLVAVLAGATTFASCAPGVRRPDPPTVLLRAHAHNDYNHTRPLLDALANGFRSVEADIYLVNGALLVAHDRADCRADRTLKALYLDPLSERVLANGGRVYPNGPPFFLLIDIKENGERVYPDLEKLLKRYPGMISTFGAQGRQSAVTVVLSGSRPRRYLTAQSTRWAALDGQDTDLEAGASPDQTPLVSMKWPFSWQGKGPMPGLERAKLRALADRANRQGCLLRLWGAPDNEAAWKELLDAKVGLINTDRLEDLRAFLLEHDPRTRPPGHSISK